jgi:hypothetical protein
MTQISRPFQIAFAAIVLFAAVWFVALRGHSSGGEGAGSSASSASAPPAAPAKAPAKAPGSGGSAAGGSVYHGPAPGVEGLTRAITKAQGAVALSQRKAKQLQEKSAQASSPGAGSSAQSSASSPSTGSNAAPTHKPQRATAGGKAGAQKQTDTASRQATVEGELEQGKVAAILFWNPKGSVDAVVHRELLAADRALGDKLAVHAASPKQVGSFGSFTRTVQVYGTPTILMVNTDGQTSTVTGLTDAFAIEQAVKEVKQAKR